MSDGWIKHGKQAKLFPYTVVGKVSGVPFEQSFMSPEGALKYKQDMRVSLGDLLDDIEIKINDVRPNAFLLPPKKVVEPWVNPWNKTGKVATTVINVFHRNAAFVTYIGYKDGTHALFVSGRKSRGEGVAFTMHDFDYYAFISKMAHEACSWKEAKYIGHHIQEIGEEVLFQERMQNHRMEAMFAWS